LGGKSGTLFLLLLIFGIAFCLLPSCEMPPCLSKSPWQHTKCIKIIGCWGFVPDAAGDLQRCTTPTSWVRRGEVRTGKARKKRGRAERTREGGESEGKRWDGKWCLASSHHPLRHLVTFA